jgi:hypothetical protein
MISELSWVDAAPHRSNLAEEEVHEWSNHHPYDEIDGGMDNEGVDYL